MEARVAEIKAEAAHQTRREQEEATLAGEQLADLLWAYDNDGQDPAVHLRKGAVVAVVDAMPSTAWTKIRTADGVIPVPHSLPPASPPPLPRGPLGRLSLPASLPLAPRRSPPVPRRAARV